MLARMSNLIITGFKTRFSSKILPPPKLIIIVPDDDFIKLLSKDLSDIDSELGSDITKAFSRMLNYIMIEFERSTAAFKEHLPAKAVRHGFPKFLWIQAPYHDHFSDNNLRFKFNRILEEMVKFHMDTFTLSLKKVWNDKNPNLYIQEAHRFTAEGYSTYWEAADRTVRYFDSILLKKQEKPKRKTLMHNTDRLQIRKDG